MQRKRLGFRIFRILFYLGVLLFFALLPYEVAQEGFFVCPSTLVGWQCPGCGVTRGMTLIMHGQLSAAWQLNPVFCGGLFPGFLLTAMQDTAVILQRKDRSFLEYVFEVWGIKI